MASPVIASMRIPEAVYPPVPGESHRYYGNIHLKQLKLPSNSFNNNLRGNTTSYPRYSEDGSIEGDLDIHEAAAIGNFTRVKELLAPRGSDSGETTSAFLLANEASPSSGMTPLHYAASRGNYEIVKWLIDDAGAIVDLEDQTGETALLKASYNGHSSVVAFLLQKQANVAQRDNDGWTALHNASAQGYLQIVKYFIEHTEADTDVKSNKGHTPLMNAASKGNIEIVEYLLSRGHANPFVKNNFGEIAYDVAATSQEVYICELLEKAERDWWKGKRPLPPPTSFKELVDLPNTDQPYDVYNFHITVPVILHENQRSSSATFGLPLRGPPKYSPNNLLKSDVRGAWSFPDGRPTSKDDVRLPVGPTSSSVSIVSNLTSSKSQKRWFWVTDWQIDMTHPRVDSQGWQYAKTFEESDRNWYSSQQSNNGTWVRRRRWVRVMKRRVDLPDDGGLQLVQDNNGQRDGPDYVEQAEAIIKRVQDNKSASEADQLGQYKEAIEILLSGSRADTNATRKQEANSFASSLMTQAEYLDNRLKGIGFDIESFKEIPMTPTLPRASSPFRFESPVNRSRSVTPTITNHNAPSTTSLKSFETMESPWNHTVPSNDAVGNSSPVLNDSAMVSPTRAHPQIGLNVTNVQANNLVKYGKWENDDEVQECRGCRKKFSLWIRRHHCRRCGRVFCDKCSTARVDLPPEQVINDPSQSGESNQSQFHRVCDQCFSSMGHTARPRPNSFTSTTVISGSSSTNHRRRLSNNSTMTECPACNLPLSNVTGSQEEHVKHCLENKNASNFSGSKYYTNSLKITPSLAKNVPFALKNFSAAKPSRE